MLTIIILGLMTNGGYGDIIPMLLSQIILGIVVSSKFYYSSYLDY